MPTRQQGAQIIETAQKGAVRRGNSPTGKIEIREPKSSRVVAARLVAGEPFLIRGRLTASMSPRGHGVPILGPDSVVILYLS